MAGITEKQTLLFVVDPSVSNLCHSKQCQFVSRLHSHYSIDKDLSENENKIFDVGQQGVVWAIEEKKINDTLQGKQRISLWELFYKLF